MLAFGARSDLDLPTKPVDLVPPIAQGFCEEMLGMTPIRLSELLQGWLCTKGFSVHGAKKNAKMTARELRETIADKLRLSFSKFHSIFLNSF